MSGVSYGEAIHSGDTGRYPTEGQVIAHLARELAIAREDYGADHSRRQRLAATLRELLDEVEPTAAEPFPYRSAEGELSYPSV